MAPPPYGAMAAPFQFVGPHGIPARAQAMNMLPFMTFGPQISVPRCAVNGPPHGQRVSNPTLREFHRTTIRRSPPRRERVWHNSSLGRTQIFYRHPNSSPPRNPGVQRHSTVSPIPPPPPPPFVPRVSNPRFYQSVEIGMPMPQPQPISFPQYYGYPGYPATFYPGVEAAPITYFPQGVGQGGLPYNVTFYPSPDYANVGNPNNGTWHPYIPNPYVQFPEAGSSAPFLNYNTPMWTPAASPEVGTWTEVVQEEEGFQYEDAPVEQLVEEPVKEEEPVEEPEKQQETIDPDIYVENVVSSDIWGTTSGEGVKSQHSDEFVIAPTCQSEQASDSNGGSSRSTPEVPPPPLSLFPSLWTPIVESEGQFWEYFRTFNRWTLSFQSLRCFLKRNSFQMRMSEIPWDILGINPTAEFERDWQELMMLIETFSADEATLTEHGIPRIRRRNRRDFKYRTYTLSAETRRRFESCQEQDVSYGQPEPVLLFDNSSSFETISSNQKLLSILHFISELELFCFFYKINTIKHHFYFRYSFFKDIPNQYRRPSE